MMIHLASTKSQSSLSTFNKTDVQPNSIDLRVESILQLASKPFKISEKEKQHRGSEPVRIENGYFYLENGTYEIIMEGLIEIGPDEAGFVITRSTLNRNGLFITSGLYDSGYHGVMAGALHVTGGPAYIKRGTRVGQFLLWKAESLAQYDGDYGVGKEHDEKYGDKEDKEKMFHYYDKGKHYEFDKKGTLIEIEEQMEFELEENKNQLTFGRT